LIGDFVISSLAVSLCFLFSVFSFVSGEVLSPVVVVTGVVLSTLVSPLPAFYQTDCDAGRIMFLKSKEVAINYFDSPL